MQLIQAIQGWSKSIDNKLQVDLILFDFLKAFGRVPHERLLSKLEYYRIHGQTRNWIASFLHDRTQKVSVNGAFSDEASVKSGVPPGSCPLSCSVSPIY